MALTGTVVRLVPDKGFGFIRGDTDREWFFHRSALEDVRFDQLHEGIAVTFDEGKGDKGPRAERVRLL